MLDSSTFKAIYTEENFSKMKYFKNFESCKMIEVKITEKIKDNDFKMHVYKDSLTISFNYLFDGMQCTVDVDLNKETEEDFNKTIVNLKDIIRMQQIEIKSNKDEIMKLIELLNQKDKEFKLKFEEIDNKFENIEEILEKNKEKNREKYMLLNPTLYYPEKDLVYSWINPNKKVNLNLLYDSNKDGFKAATFHSLCDGKGATITFIESTLGYRFGGYTTVSWDQSINNYKSDANSFIFSLSHKRKFKVTNTQYSIYSHSSNGPTFGGGCDFIIYNDCNLNNSCYSNFGHSYSKEEIQDPKTYLAGAYNFTVKRIEVYQVTD